jgi:hypothetical protein
MNTDMIAQAAHEFQCANPHLLACALVYGVGHPELYSEFRQWFGPDTEYSRLTLIFDARPEEGNEQYGPFLVRLAQGSAQPSRLLRKLAASCVDDFRSISFLFSSLDFDQLSHALRQRLDVLCEDRSEWQMKFFDTRSLDVLDRVLSGDQRQVFFGITKEWWHLDRRCQLQRIQGGDVGEDLYQSPLLLSEQQAKALIDESLPDSVLYALSLTDGDLLAEFDSGTRYEICTRSLAEATEDERDSTLLLGDRVRAALMRAQKDG